MIKKFMAKAYSEDLRKKAIDYILSGNSAIASAKKFDVSEGAVRNWYKRYREEGHYHVKYPPGKVGKASDEELCAYFDANPEKTLVQLGEHFGLTDATICYHLKRLGYRYKKKRHVIVKPVQKKEQNI